MVSMLFQPTGDCGYDLPEVPVGAILSPLQRMLITMYQEAGGWYLIPSKAWGSMAECTLVGLVIGGLWYLYITVQFLRGR